VKCSECSEEVDQAKSFDLAGMRFCGPCFIDRAGQPRELKQEDLDRLKREVQGETAGILPQQTLLDMIEGGYDRIMQGGASFDGEVERLAVEIQRLTGLAVARKTMEILDALSRMVAEQEEEVRRMIRKLGKL
jgi:hypothetical protein